MLDNKISDCVSEYILYNPNWKFWLWFGLNEIHVYVWFLFPYLPYILDPALNIKMVFEEKIPKMGTFSVFVTIFFVVVFKCYTKI